jgi:NADH:ubiquinone oxidoreductase subunit 4 (subunit M)
MVQRIFFNRVDRPENERLADLSAREGLVLAPLLALMVWMGVQPGPFLRRMEASVESVVERVQRETLVAPLADRPGVPVEVRLAADDADADAEDGR